MLYKMEITKKTIVFNFFWKFAESCGAQVISFVVSIILLLGYDKLVAISATIGGTIVGFIGGIFVLETLSVIIQVASFKTTGKRVFKMSPIHHHFELCGWSERKIVIVFALCSALLSIVALSIFYLTGRGVI